MTIDCSHCGHSFDPGDQWVVACPDCAHRTFNPAAARQKRAEAWLELWRAERDEAARNRRPMRWIPYDWRDAAPATREEEGA